MALSFRFRGLVLPSGLLLASIGILRASPGEFALDQPASTTTSSSKTADITSNSGLESADWTQKISREKLGWHTPDPASERVRLQGLLDKAKASNDASSVTYLTRQLTRIETVHRDSQWSISLEDALRIALENNYTIETSRYNPAVETTRVVEAESVFDAVFFSDLTKNKVDRPTGSQLAAAQSDFWNLSTGVRKLLPTGMQVSASHGIQRTYTTLSFQQINPEYFSNFVIQARQPFLRGFGLDYNRSLITVAQHNKKIGLLEFEREVRDTLRTVEELYWRLVQARHDLVVTARSLADFETIFDYVVSRKDFDMTPVQIFSTKANLEQSKAEFVRVRDNVWDAQDRLLAALNHPERDLSDNIEVIPTTQPTVARFDVDRLGEVQTALDNRVEIKEQQLRIESAKVAVGRAKNEELPRFDLTFRYTVDGLGPNADFAFEQSLNHDFVEYFIGVELEMPIGNRGPRAASHRARLQHSQAAAQLKSLFEQVILDVNLAVRQLSTTYDSIGPAFEAAESREREVESIVARAERKDINTLNSELGARQSLATARRGMTAAIVAYNIAIIDLERAKGTLLNYNNVVLPSSE